jgi:hypothetical protein
MRWNSMQNSERPPDFGAKFNTDCLDLGIETLDVTLDFRKPFDDLAVGNARGGFDRG